MCASCELLKAHGRQHLSFCRSVVQLQENSVAEDLQSQPVYCIQHYKFRSSQLPCHNMRILSQQNPSLLIMTLLTFKVQHAGSWGQLLRCLHHL